MNEQKHSPGPWFVCGDEGHPQVNPAWFEMLEALRFIASRENLTFAECSVAEGIIERARAAIAKAEGRP